MSQNELRNQEVIRHETKVDQNIEKQQAVNLRERVRAVHAANQNSTARRIINFIYFLFGAVEVLLLIRLTLQFIGANPANGFASFIYGLSSPFVALFATLVRNPAVGTAGVFEITTIIAIIIYAIAAWLVGQLFWLLLSRQR